MLNKTGINISIMHMHYFLEVARCRSFSRAAQQLYITQSTLSKCVASMEKDLDVQLFIRNRKSLILTEAGEHLYQVWQALLSRFEDSVDECRVLQGGRGSSLLLGVLDSHRPEDLAIPAVRSFAEHHPDIHIQMEAYPAQEVRKRLIDGTVDLVFNVLYDIEQLGVEDFDYLVLRSCPHSVCMHPDNPLAQREHLSVSDLRDSDFICISPFETPSYCGMLQDLCASWGFQPKISRYTTCASSLSYNLTRPNEVFLCDAYFRDYNNPMLCWRPLEGTSSGVVAAWRKNNGKEALALFRELLH